MRHFFTQTFFGQDPISCLSVFSLFLVRFEDEFSVISCRGVTCEGWKIPPACLPDNRGSRGKVALRKMIKLPKKSYEENKKTTGQSYHLKVWDSVQLLISNKFVTPHRATFSVYILVPCVVASYCPSALWKGWLPSPDNITIANLLLAWPWRASSLPHSATVSIQPWRAIIGKWEKALAKTIPTA